MRATKNRREFLADVGPGMLIAAVGSTTAARAGVGTVSAGEEPQRLTFGRSSRLVTLMEETSACQLVGLIVDQLKHGTELRQWSRRRRLPTPGRSAAKTTSASTR